MTPEKKEKMKKGLKIALVVFLAVAVAHVCFYRGEYRDENKQENVITFSGHGEVNAVPDIANISFTITKDAKTVKEAQAQVTEVEKKALEMLRANNVADKDFKTVSTSFNPKYEYVYTRGLACTAYGCPQGHNVVVGYESSENISVKIRNTDDAGKIVEALGTLGVTELSGPNFAVDNEDGLKVQARKLAIDDAKAKAESLAKDLGVRLGKITSFTEGSNNPTPMYAKTMMADSVAGAAPAELPKGENLISSDVSITYQLR